MWKRCIAVLESIVLFFSGWFVSILNIPDKQTQAFIEKNGYIRGICHPNEKYDLLSTGGFTWVRFDIPYPFNRDGSFTGSYLAFRRRCEGYASHGFKVMAITPYPRDYVNIGGFDPTQPENEQKVRDVAVALYRDLKNVCGAFQITNEMGIDVFTYPFTLEQAARFIGVQLEALAEVKSDFPIGYNSAGVNEKLHKLMKPYHQYCDYVGVDLYNGNGGKADARDYANCIRRIYRIAHKPIILEEFGFLSEGRRRTDEERLEILQSYGYNSEEEAKSDIENFVGKLTPELQARLRESWVPEEWGDAIFSDLRQHFYKEGSEVTYKNFGHSPQGQADYYADLLPKLRNISCLAGMILYCCQDSAKCWYCGQAGCPSETRWGILDPSGAPKPAYDVVRAYFTSPEFQ